MKLYYSDHFPLPLPDGHRFPMSKYTLLRERILNTDLSQKCALLTPLAATDQQLTLVHSRDYVQRVVTGGLSELEIKRIGFPWSLKMVERSRRSTGASICAAKAALEEGISGNLAGGTHHAFADSGQGYCVFNDVCVAAKTIQAENGIGKVLFVDCDVHQGNGTSSIARNDESLFAFSMHCDKNYPFKKTVGDLDVELSVGAGDPIYLHQLEISLCQIFERFVPDLVFYLAGADPFEGDRLGKLNLTKEGLLQRDKTVFQFFSERSIPVAFCMAGGYAPDVKDIVDIHFATVSCAADSWRFWSTP
ncbi:MAG: histone deacetylase [Planctomycetota bacterium]